MTNSTGLAVPSTELNAAINGTIANKIMEISSEIEERFQGIMTREFYINEYGQRVMKEGRPEFAQLLFMHNTFAGSASCFMIMGYGIGGQRYSVSEILKSQTHSVSVEGQSVILKNNRENVTYVKLIIFYGENPQIE